MLDNVLVRMTLCDMACSCRSMVCHSWDYSMGKACG